MGFFETLCQRFDTIDVNTASALEERARDIKNIKEILSYTKVSDIDFDLCTIEKLLYLTSKVSSLQEELEGARETFDNVSKNLVTLSTSVRRRYCI